MEKVKDAVFSADAQHQQHAEAELQALSPVIDQELVIAGIILPDVQRKENIQTEVARLLVHGVAIPLNSVPHLVMTQLLPVVNSIETREEVTHLLVRVVLRFLATGPRLILSLSKTSDTPAVVIGEMSMLHVPELVGKNLTLVEISQLLMLPARAQEISAMPNSEVAPSAIQVVLPTGDAKIITDNLLAGVITVSEKPVDPAQPHKRLAIKL